MNVNEEVDAVLTEAAAELNEEETIMTEYNNTLQAVYNQYQTINQIAMQTIAEFNTIGTICENNITLLQSMVDEYNQLDLGLKKVVVEGNIFNKELIERENSLKTVENLMKEINEEEIGFDKNLLKRENILKELSKLTENLINKESDLNKKIIQTQNILKVLNKLLNDMDLKELILNKEFTKTEQLLKKLNKLAEILGGNFKYIDEIFGKMPKVLNSFSREINHLNLEMGNLNNILEDQKKSIENVKDAFGEMNKKINIEIISNYSEAMKKANSSTKRMFNTQDKSAQKAKKTMGEWAEGSIKSILKTIIYIGNLADALNSMKELYDNVTGKEDEDNSNRVASSRATAAEVGEASNSEASATTTSTGEMIADEDGLEADEISASGGIEAADAGVEVATNSMMGPIGLAFMGITLLIDEVVKHFAELKRIVGDVCDFVGRAMDSVKNGIEKVFHSFIALPEKHGASAKNIHHMMVSEFAVTPLDHKVTSVPIVADSGFMSDFSFDMPELNNFDFEGVTDVLVEKMMTAIDKVSERPIVTKVQMNNKTIVEATHKQFNNLNGQEAELEARMRGVLVG